jgi:hypothetical protein
MKDKKKLQDIVKYNRSRLRPSQTTGCLGNPAAGFK